MKKRIPTLNEFIMTKNTLKYDGWYTDAADTIKKNRNNITLDITELPKSEIRAAVKTIANELGNEFRGSPFPFVTNWKTYVTIDIEDEAEKENFMSFLGKIGIQYDKAERGFKILLTEPNVKIAQSLIKK